jgi:hypothetical protein
VCVCLCACVRAPAYVRAYLTSYSDTVLVETEVPDSPYSVNGKSSSNSTELPLGLEMSAPELFTLPARGKKKVSD